MRLLLLLFFIPALISCQSKKNVAVPVFQGYWADSSGMAAFEVQSQENAYQIRNAMGVLEGTLDGAILRGKTEQGIAFSLTVDENTAVYSVMDLSMQYHRIDKQRYDSLLTLQN